MDNEVVKVNCSFCGKEIECPKNMLNSEKHACFECFQNLDKLSPSEDIRKIHVDIPREKMNEIMPEVLIGLLMKEVFPRLWSEAKADIKEMSKKELSEFMFLEGIQAALDLLIGTEEEIGEESFSA